MTIFLSKGDDSEDSDFTGVDGARNEFTGLRIFCWCVGEPATARLGFDNTCFAKNTPPHVVYHVAKYNIMSYNI